MGYTTEFDGQFAVTPPMDEETITFLTKFADTRRMGRDLTKLGLTRDEADKYGVDGEFWVNGGSDFGQARDASIIDYNESPRTQPGLWCHWIPAHNDPANFIEWDGGEKFYDAETWLEYLIIAVLEPRGYTLNGRVLAQGEEVSDRWTLDVMDNEVVVHHGIHL